MTWFPRECCGLLVTGPDGPCAVLADNELGKASSGASVACPLTAETGYVLDPLEIVRSNERGETLVAIFHSHCRVGAYFSDEDRRGATTPWNTPWYPNVDYVVLDVQEDGVKGYKVFSWSDAAGGFTER